MTIIAIEEIRENFKSLEVGDFFLWEGNAYLKITIEKAYYFKEKEIITFNLGENVTLVDAEIKIRHKIS